MNESFAQMTDFLSSGTETILIQIVDVKGSSPRDEGTFMFVNDFTSLGTIGGGTLEYDAINSARSFINDVGFTTSVHKYSLGPMLGQCCGGRVKLKFEKLTAKRKKKFLGEAAKKNYLLDPVLIFGAGHVGQILMRQLQSLRLQTHIIDSRPPETLDFSLPQGCKTTPLPEAEIRNAKPGSAYVILTHDHALDFLLVKEALIRNDAAYVGMIGSKTKKAILKKWLEKQNVLNFDRGFTPLGASITNIKTLGKRPEVIATLTITEILTSFEANKNGQIDGKRKLE